MGRLEDGGTCLIHTAYNTYSDLLPPLNPILPSSLLRSSITCSMVFRFSIFHLKYMLSLHFHDAQSEGICQPSDNI